MGRIERQQKRRVLDLRSGRSADRPRARPTSAPDTSEGRSAVHLTAADGLRDGDPDAPTGPSLVGPLSDSTETTLVGRCLYRHPPPEKSAGGAFWRDPLFIRDPLTFVTIVKLKKREIKIFLPYHKNSKIKKRLKTFS